METSEHVALPLCLLLSYRSNLMTLLVCSALVSLQAQSHSLPPIMHLHVPRLEGDRRRRAIAISSQQYAAHKERQRLMKMVKCSSVAQCSNINKAASSSAGTSPLPSSTSSDGVLSAKQERRAQLKAELDEEYEEALDILDDLSKPSSRLNNDDTGRQTPSQLDLQDVAVMKPARRSSEFSLR